MDDNDQTEFMSEDVSNFTICRSCRKVVPKADRYCKACGFDNMVGAVPSAVPPTTPASRRVYPIAKVLDSGQPLAERQPARSTWLQAWWNDWSNWKSYVVLGAAILAYMWLTSKPDGNQRYASKELPTTAVVKQAEVDKTKLKATRAYWQGMIATSKKLKDLTKDAEKTRGANPKTVDEYISTYRQRGDYCKRAGDKLRNAQTEIDGLSLLNVDQEALQVGSMLSSGLRQVRTVLSEGEQFCKDVVKHLEDANSWGTWFEAAMIGNKRLVTRQEQLDAVGKKMAERSEEIGRQSDKISDEIRRARILLTQRYSEEFQDID